jgi:hypothetical protein
VSENWGVLFRLPDSGSPAEQGLEQGDVIITTTASR